jgi:hypothetical protein
VTTAMIALFQESASQAGIAKFPIHHFTATMLKDATRLGSSVSDRQGVSTADYLHIDKKRSALKRTSTNPGKPLRYCNKIFFPVASSVPCTFTRLPSNFCTAS